LPEKHAVLVGNNRSKNALICAPRALNDVTRVYFVIGGQVAGNRFASHKLVRTNDAFCNNLRRANASLIVEEAACAQSAFA
jgi:hypothetical protein